MDEHGLPIVGAGVDYTKVPALEHRKTLNFLNKFIIHTAQFLNKFSNVCEERLSELSRRIQRLDISLNILEAKLSSIPDLEGVQATTQYDPPPIVASAGAPAAAGSGSAAPSAGPPPPATQASLTQTENAPIPPPPQAQPESEPKGRKAKDDPRYQKYFKMKRLGVNPLQIAMNMKREGLNPDILEDEDAELPDDGEGVKDTATANKDDEDSSDEDDDDNSDSNSSSDKDSDDSFGSD